MEFCKKCQGLLVPTPEITSGAMILECRVCKEKYPLTQYRIYYEKLDKGDESLPSYIKAALEDNTFPIIKKPCKNCPSQYVVYIRASKDMHAVYVCRQCKKWW